MVNFNLRLPDDLHAAVKAAAERDGRSAHGQMLWYLRQAVESSCTPDRPDVDPTTPAPLRASGHSPPLKDRAPCPETRWRSSLLVSLAAALFWAVLLWLFFALLFPAL